MVRRIRYRPPRIYTDKKGLYFLINKKKKYLKLDDKDKGVSTQELLNIILKKYLLKRRRRKPKKPRTIPYERAIVKGSILGELLKPRDIVEEDINLLNRRLQNLQEIKALPESTPPLLLTGPIPSIPTSPKKTTAPKIPSAPVKPKMKQSTINLNALENIIRTSKKTTDISKGLNELYNKIPKKERPKKGSKSVVNLLKILREYYGDDKVELDIQGLPFYKTMISPSEEKKSIPEEEEVIEIAENPIQPIQNPFDLPPSLEEEGKEQEASGNLRGGLKTGELNELMAKYKNFVGTYPLNFMNYMKHQKLPSSFGFIVNTDPSDKPGKHWTACNITPDSIEYYDPYGKEPSREFMKQLNKLVEKIKPSTYLKMKINKIVDQKVNSKNCGYLCSAFLINRFNGKPFREVSGYDNSHNEEKILEKFGYI